MAKNENIIRKVMRYISYVIGFATGLVMGIAYMVLKILLAVAPYLIVLGLVLFGFYKAFGM